MYHDQDVGISICSKVKVGHKNGKILRLIHEDGKAPKGGSLVLYLSRVKFSRLVYLGFSALVGSHLIWGCAAVDRGKASQVSESEPGLASTTITVDYGIDKGPSQQLASGFHHPIGIKYPAGSLIEGVVVHTVRGADHHARLPSLFDADTRLSRSFNSLAIRSDLAC